MYLPYTSFSNDNGAVMDQQTCVVVLVFSEPVAGLTANQFKVTGPSSASVSALKLLQGTSTYYHLLISVADDYIGKVNVAIIVSLSPPSRHLTVLLKDICSAFGLDLPAYHIHACTSCIQMQWSPSALHHRDRSGTQQEM